jgi:hypothetical protein
LAKKTKAELRAAISEAVQEQLVTLQAAIPEYFARFAIKEIRASARKIVKTINTLEYQLKTAPIGLRPWLQLDDPFGAGRSTQVKGNLRILRRMCEDAVETLPNEDPIRRWCAKTAWFLMQKFSTNEPTSKTAKDPFRQIASSIYEYIADEPDRDLERACNDVLRIMRAIT